MSELNDVQQAVFNLLKSFVSRNALILQVMRAVRPERVMRALHEGTPEEMTHATLQYARTKGTGFWGENNEWEYYVHGAGCRLTHRETGERLEWDIGDLNEFDLYWFVNYLESRLQNNLPDSDLEKVRPVFIKGWDEFQNEIFRLIKDLINVGVVINSRQTHKARLN